MPSTMDILNNPVLKLAEYAVYLIICLLIFVTDRKQCIWSLLESIWRVGSFLWFVLEVALGFLFRVYVAGPVLAVTVLFQAISGLIWYVLFHPIEFILSIGQFVWNATFSVCNGIFLAVAYILNAIFGIPSFVLTFNMYTLFSTFGRWVVYVFNWINTVLDNMTSLAFLQHIWYHILHNWYVLENFGLLLVIYCLHIVHSRTIKKYRLLSIITQSIVLSFLLILMDANSSEKYDLIFISNCYITNSLSAFLALNCTKGIIEELRTYLDSPLSDDLQQKLVGFFSQGTQQFVIHTVLATGSLAILINILEPDLIACLSLAYAMVTSLFLVASRSIPDSVETHVVLRGFKRGTFTTSQLFAAFLFMGYRLGRLINSCIERWNLLLVLPVISIALSVLQLLSPLFVKHSLLFFGLFILGIMLYSAYQPLPPMLMPYSASLKFGMKVTMLMTVLVYCSDFKSYLLRFIEMAPEQTFATPFEMPAMPYLAFSNGSSWSKFGTFIKTGDLTEDEIVSAITTTFLVLEITIALTFVRIFVCSMDAFENITKWLNTNGENAMAHLQFNTPFSSWCYWLRATTEADFRYGIHHGVYKSAERVCVAFCEVTVWILQALSAVICCFLSASGTTVIWLWDIQVIQSWLLVYFSGCIASFVAWVLRALFMANVLKAANTKYHQYHGGSAIGQPNIFPLYENERTNREERCQKSNIRNEYIVRELSPFFHNASNHCSSGTRFPLMSSHHNYRQQQDRYSQDVALLMLYRNKIFPDSYAHALSQMSTNGDISPSATNSLFHVGASSGNTTQLLSKLQSAPKAPVIKSANITEHLNTSSTTTFGTYEKPSATHQQDEIQASYWSALSERVPDALAAVLLVLLYKKSQNTKPRVSTIEKLKQVIKKTNTLDLGTVKRRAFDMKTKQLMRICTASYDDEDLFRPVFPVVDPPQLSEKTVIPEEIICQELPVISQEIYNGILQLWGDEWVYLDQISQHHHTNRSNRLEKQLRRHNEFLDIIGVCVQSEFEYAMWHIITKGRFVWNPILSIFDADASIDLVPTGSFRELTCLPAMGVRDLNLFTLETDIMLVHNDVSVQIIPTQHAGFVKVKVVSQDWLGCMNPISFMAQEHKLIREKILKSGDYFQIVDIDHCKPCVTMVYTPDETNPTGSFRTDLVPAFPIPWPQDAKEWSGRINRFAKDWPDQDVVQKIVDAGAHVVAKSHYKNMSYWRLSFSNAEFMLMQTLGDTYRHALMILKAIRRQHFDSTIISSYILKTCLFYEVEKSGLVNYQVETQQTLIGNVLANLLIYLNEKMCPHYFVVGNNLFERFPGDALEKEAAEVKHVLDNLGHYLNQDLFRSYDVDYTAKQVGMNVTRSAIRTSQYILAVFAVALLYGAVISFEILDFSLHCFTLLLPLSFFFYARRINFIQSPTHVYLFVVLFHFICSSIICGISDVSHWIQTMILYAFVLVYIYLRSIQNFLDIATQVPAGSTNAIIQNMRRVDGNAIFTVVARTSGTKYLFFTVPLFALLLIALICAPPIVCDLIVLVVLLFSSWRLLDQVQNYMIFQEL